MNDWKTYVRYFVDFEAEYRYDTIENTNKLISKTKELLEYKQGVTNGQIGKTL